MDTTPPAGYTPQPPYPPQPYNPYYAAPARPTEGLAIAGMVLGICWVWWVGSLLAVIFGHVALSHIKHNGKQGSGMATAGLVLGYIGLATLLIFMVAVGASTGT